MHRDDLVAVGENGRHDEEEGGYKARQIGEPTHDVENCQLMRAGEEKGSNGEKECIKSKTDDDYSDIRNTQEANPRRESKQERERG